MTTTVLHNLTNDTREAEFDTFTREKGRESATGKDALPAWAIGFVRAVYDGVFPTAKDANGEDAAMRKFKMYAASEGKKAYHDRSQGSQKAQVSKVRQLMNAAANPKYDFVDVLNRGITIRQEAIDAGIEVKSPFPAYVDLAREQLKQDDELDDATIYAVVIKNEVTREVTVEGQLKKALKIVEDLIGGEKNPGVIDQSPEVLQVGELLNTRISEVVALREANEKVEKAIELGMVKNDDGSWSLPN
jgi:hypothetical protein